jgi:hypothetical protein
MRAVAEGRSLRRRETMSDESEQHHDCEKCGGLPNSHPVVHIEHGEWFACVDEDIAPLVLACWELGIRTRESCQDFDTLSDVRSMYLSFRDLDDYIRFGERLLEGGPRDQLYARIFPRSGTDRALWWDWEAVPGERDDDLGDESVQCTWFVSVAFPADDLGGAVDRLRRGT